LKEKGKRGCFSRDGKKEKGGPEPFICSLRSIHTLGGVLINLKEKRPSGGGLYKKDARHLKIKYGRGLQEKK